MNKVKLVIGILFLAISGYINAQIFIGAGTNIGGALPVEKTEGSSAVLYPGAYISFGNKFSISNNLSFSPQLSFDFKLFDYFAKQRKDTIVETEVFGVIANVPTYYQANIHGKIRLFGVYAEMPFEYRFGKKAGLNLGIYASALPIKSDEIMVNVKIGEGGLLPDIDSFYNNKSKINSFDTGIMLGGNFQFNDKLSIFINAYRSITRFYKMNAVKNEEGNDIPFYYTQARVGIRYYFL